MNTATNTIEIDERQLSSELERIETPESAEPPGPIDPAAPGAAPGAVVPAGEPTLEQLQAAVPQWRMGSDIVTNLLCDTIAPNWSVTAEERRGISDSMSMALEAWFPGQYIPVRFQVLFGVGSAVWMVITARRQANGGKLPPMRLAPPAKAKPGEKGAPTDPNATPAAQASTATSSGVTTSG